MVCSVDVTRGATWPPNRADWRPQLLAVLRDRQAMFPDSRGCQEEEEQTIRGFRRYGWVGEARAHGGRFLRLRDPAAACRWLAAAQRNINKRDELLSNVGIGGRCRKLPQQQLCGTGQHG
jgi:hypothetical protein